MDIAAMHNDTDGNQNGPASNGVQTETQTPVQSATHFEDRDTRFVGQSAHQQQMQQQKQVDNPPQIQMQHTYQGGRRGQAVGLQMRRTSVATSTASQATARLSTALP